MNNVIDDRISSKFKVLVWCQVGYKMILLWRKEIGVGLYWANLLWTCFSEEKAIYSNPYILISFKIQGLIDRNNTITFSFGSLGNKCKLKLCTYYWIRVDIKTAPVKWLEWNLVNMLQRNRPNKVKASDFTVAGGKWSKGLFNISSGGKKNFCRINMSISWNGIKDVCTVYF